MRKGETVDSAARANRRGGTEQRAGEIESLVLTAPTDESGGPIPARVEYSLAGGGWRPSEARVTDVLTGPTAVSLADVQNDIDAVRVTYLNARDGRKRKRTAALRQDRLRFNIKTGVDGSAA